MSSVNGRRAKPSSLTSPNRFERSVDPDNLLSPEERAHRAEQLRSMVQFARRHRREVA